VLWACTGGGGGPGGVNGATSQNCGGGSSAPAADAKKGTCRGGARSCSVLTSGATCGSQSGCLWHGAQSERYCTGSANSCDSFNDDYSCERQDGCHWEEANAPSGAEPCPAPTASGSASGPPSSSSASGSPPPPSPCTGSPFACSKYLVDACGSQPNCESSYSGACSERRYSGPPSCGAETEKSQCVAIIGCTWQNPDGTKEAIVHGTCEGDAAPCDGLTETECGAQPGYVGLRACRWERTDYNGTFITRCVKEGSETACGSFSASAPAPDASYVRHPSEAKSKCETRKGCTWKPSP
jgi:hypothetical protein